MRFIIIIVFHLVILPWSLFQAVHGQPVVEDKNPALVKNDDAGKIAWEVNPGMEWKKIMLKNPPADRKRYLGDLYEEIDGTGEAVLSEKTPTTGSLFGLKIFKYYVIGSRGDETWKVVDIFGQVQMRFSVFYSSDRVYSRQAALEKLGEMVGCMPHINSGLFTYQTRKDGERIVIRKDQSEKEIYLAEKDGYSLWIDSFYPLGSSSEEAVQVIENILDALSGKKKFGFFPARARRLEAMGRMSPAELSRRRDLLKKEAKSRMAPDILDGISGRSMDLIKILGVRPLFEEARDKEKRDLFPNINSGIGTLAWIRKHMDIPFEPAHRNDETHVNGISGTFMFQQDGKKYPVRYMISHLGSHVRALCALFSMHCEERRMDVRKIAEITRLHPGLAGDYDLGLLPILNELGVPIPNSEQAWICFVRGSTAVMLKSEDLQVSVLPLARIIDEALKKNMELYETPEVVR